MCLPPPSPYNGRRLIDSGPAFCLILLRVCQPLYLENTPRHQHEARRNDPQSSQLAEALNDADYHPTNKVVEHPSVSCNWFRSLARS